eukprot:scaffold133402_cov61-Phaeocystis_antarctica.AAC.1
MACTVRAVHGSATPEARVLVGAYRVEGIRILIPPRAPESARETAKGCLTAGSRFRSRTALTAKLAFVGFCTGLRCVRGRRTAHSSPESAAPAPMRSSNQWCTNPERIGRGQQAPVARARCRATTSGVDHPTRARTTAPRSRRPASGPSSPLTSKYSSHVAPARALLRPGKSQNREACTR